MGNVQIVTMKFLVGVLAIALAAIAQAEPEADPAVLYGAYYGHPYHLGYGYGSHCGFYNGFYARSAYGYGLPGHSYTHVDRLHKREVEADPQLIYANTAFPYVTAPAAFTGVAPVAYNTVPVATAPFAPVAPVAPVAAPPAGVAVARRPFTPHDCVTSDGCAVRALKEAGLAKREADPEAQAEADAYYRSYYNYGYNPYYNYYNGFYNYANNPYGPYVAPVVKTVEVEAPEPVEVMAAPAPVIAAAPYYYNVAPVAAPVAAPVEVKAAPAPVIASAPYYAAAPVAAPVVYNTPAVVAPAPVAPIVEQVSKPVTYTHLGAHPIQPTTVLETESRLVY